MRLRFAQEEAEYWVNVTLCGQVQVTVDRQGQANVVLCSLVPSLLKMLYAANLSCVFVLGFCFS